MTQVRSNDDDDDDDEGDIVQADMLDCHFLCETSSNDAVIAKARVFRRTGIRTHSCIVCCQDIHRLSSGMLHLYFWIWMHWLAHGLHFCSFANEKLEAVETCARLGLMR